MMKVREANWLKKVSGKLDQVAPTRLLWLLAIATLPYGCREPETSALRTENAKLRSEIQELRNEMKVLRKEVQIAISASTNSLSTAKAHSKLIDNINSQLSTLSDAMTNALQRERVRQFEQLAR